MYKNDTAHVYDVKPLTPEEMPEATELAWEVFLSNRNAVYISFLRRKFT